MIFSGVGQTVQGRAGHGKKKEGNETRSEGKKETRREVEKEKRKD